MVQQEHSAHGAPQGGIARSQIRANGCRRVTLEMRAWLDRADSFKGLPQGTAKPLIFLYTFKEAEPYLGLPVHTYKLVDWLVRLTKPQDWEEGSRPIAWPEARRQEEFLGLSTRQAQALNRALQEAGIFVMRDDPQGRRYGHRDPKTGRITKAFGFDLSLLMERHEEFKKIAAEAQTERNRMKKLRQRKTIARKAIAQAAEELGVQGYDSEALQCLMKETAELIKVESRCHESGDLAMVVQALERRQDEIQRMLSDLIKPVETAPMGAENRTHNTTTTLIDNDNNHTVIAAKDSSRVEAPPVPDNQEQPKPKHLFPESLHITPATLVKLAPRLAPYVPARTEARDWPAIVEAALFLSAEMGINRTFWARACQIMGREYAAIAMAIVSTYPAEHFTKSAGSYFGGMVKKFEKNPQDLCLSRTLWRLKEQTWGAAGHKERRDVERQRRIEMSTKKTLHPDLNTAGPIDAPQAPTNSGGGFRSVGTVLQSQLVTPTLPARRAIAMPANRPAVPSVYSKTWQPSQELREAEERINAMFAKPRTDTAKPHNGSKD
jgi:replication initiation protein RepC